MIHSIDRKCGEAWDIPIPAVKGGGSCVPTVPGFPHCHTSCQMTWNLGPGGVGSWGMSLLNHHIPSPKLALGQYDRASVTTTFNDVGCGSK